MIEIKEMEVLEVKAIKDFEILEVKEITEFEVLEVEEIPFKILPIKLILHKLNFCKLNINCKLVQITANI